MTTHLSMPKRQPDSGVMACTYFPKIMTTALVCTLGLCFAASTSAEYWQHNYDGFGRVLAVDGPSLEVSQAMVKANGDSRPWGDYAPWSWPGYNLDPHGATTRNSHANRDIYRRSWKGRHFPELLEEARSRLLCEHWFTYGRCLLQPFRHHWQLSVHRR